MPRYFSFLTSNTKMYKQQRFSWCCMFSFLRWSFTGHVPSMREANRLHHLHRQLSADVRPVCKHLTPTVDRAHEARSWLRTVRHGSHSFFIDPLRRRLLGKLALNRKFSATQPLSTFSTPALLALF